jgi:NADPH:quinone reductase-like Zn-dependent oxidoreductase
MKFKRIIVARRGGPEVLQIEEVEMRPPVSEEVRIKILATPICRDDIAVRIGNRPFLAKPPFTPGYSILGTVEAMGEAVSNFALGDRVAALTVLGGHSEYIYLPYDKLVHVPPGLDAAEAVVLILNYLVAYQVLHRVARVKSNDKALLVGASGGVGTAFLQLGNLAGLTMYGLASPRKHDVLTEYGAIPMDYHSQDFVRTLRQNDAGGLDFVFNGRGEEYIERGLAVLRRGGTFVHYGGPESFSRFLLLMAKFVLYGLLPNGKSIKAYGTHRGDVNVFKADWRQLFRLLEEGQIEPIISERFPILEAARSYERLEGGEVTGHVVLMAPELL